MGKFCGKLSKKYLANKKMTSTTNKIEINFVAGNNAPKRGFRFKIRAVPIDSVKSVSSKSLLIASNHHSDLTLSKFKNYYQCSKRPYFINIFTVISLHHKVSLTLILPHGRVPLPLISPYDKISLPLISPRDLVSSRLISPHHRIFSLLNLPEPLLKIKPGLDDVRYNFFNRKDSNHVMF